MIIPPLTPIRDRAPADHPMIERGVTIAFKPIDAGGRFFEPPPVSGVLIDIDYSLRSLLIYRIIQDDSAVTHEQLVMHNLDDVFSITMTMGQKEDSERE